MKKIDEFVKDIPFDDKLQIMRDYDEFERTGSTGETKLREYTEAWMEEAGISTYAFLITAEMVVARVWKFFALVTVYDDL